MSNTGRPGGVVPKHIREWLKVNNDMPYTMCVCPKCHRWYASMDHLAPYHTERNYCKHCKQYKGHTPL